MGVGGVILAIETSNPGPRGRGGVALARRTPGGTFEVLAERSAGGPTEDLMAAIARACEGAGVSPTELERVVVSLGPGGYTSLRIAVTAAKMIARATGASCVGVPTAEVVAASTPRGAGACVVALASKGETAYVAIVDASGRVTGEPGEMGASGIAALGVDVLIADGHLPPSMREAARARGMRVVEPRFDAAACARLGADRPATEPTELIPIYPREAEAIRLWRARGGDAGGASE